MKYNYPPLGGICGKCKFKCGRCEDINFKGVWRCEYYLEEAKDEISIRDKRESNRKTKTKI